MRSQHNRIESVTGIIRAQRAYAIQKQGTVEREREAQSIYNSVLRSKPSDIGLVAVASNNLIAINKVRPLTPLLSVSFM